MAHNPAQNPDENLTLEEERERQADAQNRQFLFFLAAFPVIPVFKQQTLYTAFSSVKDPDKFAENILDFQNPEKLVEANNAVKTVRQRFADKKVGEDGSLTARVLVFGGVNLTHEEVERRNQAVSLANNLSLRVNEVELDLRIDSAILSHQFQGGPQQIKTMVKEWRENNPQGTLDEAFTRIYLSQKEGFSLEKPEDKNKQQELEQKYQQAQKTHAMELNGAYKAYQKTTENVRAKAIETAQKDPVFQKAEALTKQVLNPKAPFIPTNTFNEQVKNILNPAPPTPKLEDMLAKGTTDASSDFAADLMGEPLEQIPTETKKEPAVVVQSPNMPKIDESILAQGFAETPLGEEIVYSSDTPRTVSPPLVNTKPAVAPRVLSQLVSNLQNRINTLTQAINRVVPGLSAISRRLNFVRSGIARLGAGIATRAGLRQVFANIIAPGVGGAVSLAYDVLNGLTGGLIGEGAKMVIICLIGVVVAIAFLPFLLSSSAFQNYGVKDAKIISAGSNDQGWYEFEKKFLVGLEKTNDNPELNTVSWQQFEKENLRPLSKYLSLDKK